MKYIMQLQHLEILTDAAVQIKVAKTLNDALNNNELIINSAGGVLRVESRVSDKKPGEIGHPIQYDSTQSLMVHNSHLKVHLRIQ